MEPNAANVLSSPSADQLANGDFGSRLSFKESLSCGSKPRLQLLELTENIENAEISYNEAKVQWEYYKSLQHSRVYGQNESTPKSISSLNSFKSTTSEHSGPREEMAQLGSSQDVYSKDGERSGCNDGGQGDQVQVVLTPRTPKDSETNVEGVPQLAIRTSLNSVKTNKRSSSKRTSKLKKKPQLSRMQSETTKPIPNPTTLKARRRKCHARLKTSNSKSTVGTRDTNFSDKKADRRKFRKQKSLETISVFQAPQFKRKTNPLKGRESKQLNDNVTELYHNKALKSGSLSVVPSRHTKLEHTPYGHLHSHQYDQPIQPTTDAANDKKPTLVAEDKKKAMSVAGSGVENTFIGSEPPSVEQKTEIEIKTETQEQTYTNHMHHHHYTQEYYNAFQQRNYEMPTESSKMKRVYRPYYQRFNVRNIPFVVGTSISPSHNLGLNIQQVLSIIKSRQPTVPGISPLLIRKVSKGIRPVSTLFEEINNEVTKSCRNINFQNSHNQKPIVYNQSGGTLSCEHIRGSNVNSSISSSTANQAPYKQSLTCEPLYEEDEDTHSSSSEVHSKVELQEKNSYQCQMRSEASIKNHHQHHVCHRHSGKHITQTTASGVGDYTADMYNYPANSHEMTDVFKRFYSQYEKMTSELEKLKEQSDKRKDKSMAKEISELETSITAKEKEITAVVNLYKEVMSLKQQMRMLHERNSFVCIATQDPAFRHAKMMRSRAKTAGPFEVKYQRSEIHGTPNALRLAGLLRQIQAFQRQLNLV